MTISVLIVDDLEVIRSGFVRMLERTSDIKIVGEATTGEEAYAQYKKMKKNVDVIVLDITMPGMGGMQFIEEIRASDKNVKILVFSVVEDAGLIRKSFDLGVNGYISKTIAAEKLALAIREVALGKIFYTNDIARKLVNGVVLKTPDRLKNLLPKERRIYQMIIDLYDDQTIIEELNISMKTLRNNKASIKQKLGIAGSTKAIIEFGKNTKNVIQ